MNNKRTPEVELKVGGLVISIVPSPKDKEKGKTVSKKSSPSFALRTAGKSKVVLPPAPVDERVDRSSQEYENDLLPFAFGIAKNYLPEVFYEELMVLPKYRQLREDYRQFVLTAVVEAAGNKDKLIEVVKKNMEILLNLHMDAHSVRKVDRWTESYRPRVVELKPVEWEKKKKK